MAFLLLLVLLVLQPTADAVFDNAEIILAPGDYLDLGQLSRFEYFVLVLVITVFTVIWSVGVIPFDIPVKMYTRRKRDLLLEERMGLQPLVWDCPLQFVCEVDYWANRDHDTMLEATLARWLRNSSNHTFSSPKGRTFAGVPDTCPEMYPCPFDVQETVGFRIPGSSLEKATDVDYPDPDSLMAFY